MLVGREIETCKMVRKKIDNRVRTLIENGVTTGHRTMFIVIGEKARDQASEKLKSQLTRLQFFNLYAFSEVGTSNAVKHFS